MTRFKSFNEVVLSMLERLRLTQPQLDTKPNSVARDVFIDPPSFEIGDLYETLRSVARLQSLANMTGNDLTNFGANFGASRKTGTKASGQVVFTFRKIDTNVTISAGTIVTTRNGLSFATISSTTVRTSDSNALRATATRLRQELDTAGITDQYAIEVSVQAQSIGSSGNIATYSIVSHSASGVNSVTNVTSFTGGSDVETDAAFRSRVLATFAGANTGTSLGYRSLILALADAVDALVVEPGNPLMIRDGTTNTTDSSGNTVVAQPGTGGKIDIYVLGENLQAGTDSFIYKDKSGKNDPTDSNNDYVLGQSSLTPSTTLSLNSRRLGVLSDGEQIPTQPVSSITSVSGSSSGPNFVEQYLDEYGNLVGNYKLVNDSGAASGSPFGLDKIVWTSDHIDLVGENRTKGTFNGIDGLSYTDILTVSGITQDVRVTNENSSVTSGRNYVVVKHKPVRTVNRVFNLTTGERYTISSQNPDGQSGSLNTTGRIKISGRTLPTASDVLQVDYAWVMSFAPQVEFDTLDPKDVLNEAQDSVDWGFPNYIRDELSTATLDAYNNLTVKTTYPIGRTLSVNTFVKETLTVAGTSSRKTVTTVNSVGNIHSIKDTTLNGAEVYNTLEGDGTFSNRLIALPSDSLAALGDQAVVTHSLTNLLDAYQSGATTGRTITLFPSTLVSSGIQVMVNYVADLLNVLPQTNFTSLPAAGDGYNSFTSIDGYQPVLDLFSGSTITDNKRRTPAHLKVTVAAIPTQGILEVVGTTMNKISGVFMTTSASTGSSNIVDLAPLIRTVEGLGRTATIPSSITVGRIVSLEKVSLSISGTVDEVLATYDLTNYGLKTSRWDLAHAIQKTAIGNASVQLAAVSANTSSPITTGTHLRATFYYAKQNDYERPFFSKNGFQITDKVFAKVTSIGRVSGFTNSAGAVSGRFSLDTVTQPEQNSAYTVDYSYTAPKNNERITVNYEYNKLIGDATYAVEDGRPITADVLVKAAGEVSVDVTAEIIVLPAYETSSATVKQDVADNISASLNATALKTTVDVSDVIAKAYGVEGLDKITITHFNKHNVTGTVTSIVANRNEYLAAGTVTVTVKTR
jgi:uncharacterized phage protein gp47/JayE